MIRNRRLLAQLNEIEGAHRLMRAQRQVCAALVLSVPARDLVHPIDGVEERAFRCAVREGAGQQRRRDAANRLLLRKVALNERFRQNAVEIRAQAARQRESDTARATPVQKVKRSLVDQLDLLRKREKPPYQPVKLTRRARSAPSRIYQEAAVAAHATTTRSRGAKWSSAVPQQHQKCQRQQVSRARSPKEVRCGGMRK